MSGGSVDAVTTVAVVEDDTDILAAVIRGLTERGHVVLGASTGLGALGEIVEQRPDLVVLDLGLPDIDGLEHRGWKGRPLYDVRKLLLLGAERVDEAGWVRIHAAKERVRDVYGTDDPEQAAARLHAAIAWCVVAESGPEFRRLAKRLRRWLTQPPSVGDRCHLNSCWKL